MARRVVCSLAGVARDSAGTTAVMIVLSSTMLLGFAALGTEAGYWYFIHRNMQNAADSAAMSSVAALFNGTTGDYTSEARYTAATYSYVHNTGGVAVTVNKPPTSGSYTTTANAVEVIIAAPQKMFLTAALPFFGTPVQQPTQKVRAVATPGMNGNGCVVALDKGNVGDVFTNGTTNLNLQGCDMYVNSSANSGGNYALDATNNASITAQNVYVVGGIDPAATITTSGGKYSGVAPINDPYINVPAPPINSTCPDGLATSYNNATINPGVYCGGLTLKGTITMTSGIYIIEGGQFTDNGQASITGHGVLIYLTNTNGNGSCATMAITGTNTTLNLTPLQDGSAYQALSIYQDRNCTANASSNANNIGGGSNMSIVGAVYFPNQNVTFDGGATTGGSYCEQIVALTVTFHGNSELQNDCFGQNGNPTINGMGRIGAIPAKLVE